MSTHDLETRRRFRLAFALLIAGSAAFRVAYVLLVKRDDPLWSDEVFYTNAAVLIAEGDGFQDPFVRTMPSAGHAPMTVVALAPVSWLDGVVTAQRLMMVIYGTMVVAGIGALTRLLFDRRTALVATAFAGIYGGLWLNDVMVMSETFAALAVVGLLFAAYWYRRHPGWGSAALFGVVTCLAGYARAELLVLGGMIGIFTMWLNHDPTRTRNGPDGISRWVGFGHLAAAGLVTVVLLAPWVIRNHVVFEEPVLISTQDGGTLLGANCPKTYNGRFVGFWLLECVSVVPRLAHEDSSQAEAQYREEALAFIGTHTAELPRVAAFRVGRGLGLYRPNDMTIINQLEGRNRVASWISTIQFWVLGVLAFIGLMWWPTRDRWRVPRWPVVATVVFTVLMMAISYGNPRFRIPLEPGLVIAAAVGAIALVERFRGGVRRVPSATRQRETHRVRSRRAAPRTR